MIIFSSAMLHGRSDYSASEKAAKLESCRAHLTFIILLWLEPRLPNFGISISISHATWSMGLLSARKAAEAESCHAHLTFFL